MDVKPFLHEHYLLVDPCKNQKATCDKCNQDVFDSGYAYHCESCNFWLHSACAEQQLPPQISHPLHSKHPLTLYDDHYDFVCEGCFTLSRGHRYRCRDCNFIIEVLCASYTKDDALEKQGQRSDDRYKMITHFIYYDSLTLFKHRKVKSNDYSCRWCDKFLSGMCYGSFEGLQVFYVHESCLRSIPTRILKHPFHPAHPLYLLKKENSETYCNACKDIIKSDAYSCRKCEFWLHFLCATRALQPSLKHEFHEHSLSYFQINYSPVAFQCNMCDEKICKGIGSSNFYRCVQCDVNLHLRCVPVPRTTKHRYHRHALTFVDSFVEDDSGEYYCDICEEERNQKHPIYFCEKCKYAAHIQCALNKVDSKALIPELMEQEETEEDNAESDQFQLEIEHFNHGHPLQFYEVIENFENLHCKACYFEITNQAYGCESCKYYIHKTCAKLSHEVLHPLHPQHSLKLIANTDTFLCHECGDLTIGFIYTCYLCDFTLDVKCAISTTLKNESQRLKKTERESKLCFFSQDHKLSFFNSRLEPYPDSKCSICCLPILGPTYGCGDCNYVLHESCLGFPLEIQLPIFQGSHLHPIIINRDDCSCSACGGRLDEYSINYCYRLRQYRLKFHLQCANSLRRAIESESHEHPLFYFGTECHKLFANMRDFHKALYFFECKKCNKPCSGVPFFRCLTCGINLHLECVPIPHPIKSKCHIHPFSLKDYFVEDDSGEYYCDVCEEERHPKNHVYYCEECHGLFVAHIECVLNQVEGTTPATEASSNWELRFQKFFSLPGSIVSMDGSTDEEQSDE